MVSAVKLCVVVTCSVVAVFVVAVFVVAVFVIVVSGPEVVECELVAEEFYCVYLLDQLGYFQVVGNFVQKAVDYVFQSLLLFVVVVLLYERVEKTTNCYQR